jgi:cell division septation protein DedD
VGAFGNEANASTLVAKLIGLGYPARMRAASTSSGDIVYRVWIGYFASRNEAARFAQQSRDQIGDANPVHR